MQTKYIWMFSFHKTELRCFFASIEPFINICNLTKYRRKLFECQNSISNGPFQMVLDRVTNLVHIFHPFMSLNLG